MTTSVRVMGWTVGAGRLPEVVADGVTVMV